MLAFLDIFLETELQRNFQNFIKFELKITYEILITFYDRSLKSFDFNLEVVVTMPHFGPRIDRKGSVRWSVGSLSLNILETVH